MPTLATARINAEKRHDSCLLLRQRARRRLHCRLAARRGFPSNAAAIQPSRSRHAVYVTALDYRQPRHAATSYCR